LEYPAPRANAGRFDLTHDGGEVGEHQWNLSGEKIVDGPGFAAIGDVHHLDAGVVFKKLRRHMRGRADPAGAEIDLAGTGLGHRDHVGDRMGGKGWIGHQHQR
jgi:hypothetical protein